MARKRDGGWRLPDPAVTDDRRCVRLDIPDDPIHIANLRGVLYQLARASNYQAGRQQDARDAAQMWLQIVDTLFQDCDCPDCEDEMNCEEVIACIEPLLAQVQAQQATNSQQVWQQMPSVTEVLDNYDTGGPTAVDPTATGLFRRDNTAIERYISIAAIYAVAHSWQLAQYNKLRTRAIGAAGIVSVSNLFRILPNVIPNVAGIIGDGAFGSLLPDLNALADIPALGDVIASAWMEMHDQPETFTGWQVGATASYYVDTPEEQALNALVASQFFAEEKNFIAYLAIRPVISERVHDGGQPFFGRGIHWTDDELVNNEYAEWLLDRGESTTWQGVTVLQGTAGANGQPTAVSDGSHFHVEAEITLDRAVALTKVSVDYERVQQSGQTFNNLQNIRRVEIYNGDAEVWSQEYDSDSVAPFPAFTIGTKGQGVLGDRVVIYGRRRTSKTVSMVLTRIRICGEGFPPTNFWT